MKEGEILDGKYRLGRKIGEGSLGRVYEAQHTTLARVAAVKVFGGDLVVHAGGADRFLADARAAWKVRHRNIVDVYEFGRLGEHIVYVAMERIEGRSLQAYLDQHGRLPWSRARGIALQVVAALKAAHRRRILHRGLKATNCFVLGEDDDEAPRIKVGDFATVRTGTAKLDPEADQTSVFLGDPAYAAPELNAKAEPSVQSDVYAVGVLLFRMLTGELPFTGDTPFQVLVGHAEAPVPLPRDKEPSIPEEVEAIILHALAKEPSERFESVRELELALEEVPPEAGEPEEADVPEVPLEEQKTGEHRQAETPSRDEAMHAAFERQSMDGGESEATSMFAPQRLFPYYGPAAQDLQARAQLLPPPTPPQAVPRALDPSPPWGASSFGTRAGGRAAYPDATVSLPGGGVPPSSPQLPPQMGHRAREPLPPRNVPTFASPRGPSTASEGTVSLPGGGVPTSSPERTVPLDASNLRETFGEATVVLDRPTKLAAVESTERLEPLNEDAPAVSTGRMADLVESEAGEIAPEEMVHLPADGVPVAAARRSATQPAPQGNVAPAAPIASSSSAVSPGPARLPERAMSSPPAGITAKHVIISVAAAIVGTLVGLGLACPVRAASEHPSVLREHSPVPPTLRRTRSLDDP